eukprot:GHUV01051548.1.p1 GENE.GHUV01051548.1~~GHUV01051548.1.p1  ORF type:complete len:110 (+),score=18.60 GHUV01051548.1:23-352(+)
MWVELDHSTKVLEWVLFQGIVLGASNLGCVDNTLYLIAVDQASDVSVCHAGARQLVALLGLTLCGLRTCNHRRKAGTDNALLKLCRTVCIQQGSTAQRQQFIVSSSHGQ